MNAKQAHDKLWKLEYTATVNQLFYQELSSLTAVVARLTRILTILLALVGGVIGLIGAFVSTSSITITVVSFGLVSMALAVLLDILAISAFTTYFSELHEQWTELRGKCEQLYVHLPAPSEDHVPEDVVTEIASIQDKKTGIDRTEKVRWGLNWFHRRCQRQINRQTYAVSEGTYEEVMTKLESHQAA